MKRNDSSEGCGGEGDSKVQSSASDDAATGFLILGATSPAVLGLFVEHLALVAALGCGVPRASMPLSPRLCELLQHSPGLTPLCLMSLMSSVKLIKE